MKCRCHSERNFLVLLFVVILIVACKAEEQELTFESIAQGDGFYTGRSYRGESPAFLILTDFGQVEPNTLDIEFSKSVEEELRLLDYTESFVVLVLQGYKPTTNYSITVQQITRQGKQISISVSLVEPQVGTRIKPAFTSPYQLVTVSKQGNRWGREFQFVLLADETVLATTSHIVP